ncbi:linear amide C-N hydrolase, partial [Vibrio anguillarum]
THSITIVSELLPDTSNTQSHLHLALSDADGCSGVIEVRNGRFELYESPQDTVVTNQPDYKTQRMLTAYWQYIWGKRPNAPVEHPVFSAPGGNSATQRFERASYYFTFAQPAKKRREAVYQAKSLVAACSVPVYFNPYCAEKASYTIWTNLADHRKKVYSLSSTVTMNTLSLHFSPELTTS